MRELWLALMSKENETDDKVCSIRNEVNSDESISCACEDNSVRKHVVRDERYEWLSCPSKAEIDKVRLICNDVYSNEFMFLFHHKVNMRRQPCAQTCRSRRERYEWLS